MGIKICSNKGAGPNNGQNKENLIDLQKSSFLEPFSEMHW